MVESLTLFYSYAHEDEAFRQQLEKHLVLLRREGLLSSWHDGDILPGEMWQEEIDQHLQTASIILFLLSPDLLASDHFVKEMQSAFERHGRGEAYIIPVILRPCDWQPTPLKNFQCLPRDGKPLSLSSDQDGAFHSIAQSLRDYIEKQKSLAHPLSPVDRKNRKNMLKRVRAIWVDGLLKQSLHDAARIELRLQDRPDVLVSPMRLQVQELHQPAKALPDGTTVVQAYDRGDGELLLLGKPGAGKTTLLLELTRTLLERAERVERLRIPVVFNLSSWAKKRQALTTWLKEELATKYQVPYKIGQRWIDDDQILPLLDGLDEMAKEVRDACVQGINDYCQLRLELYGECSIVICCRTKEYHALSTRSLLQNAVSIVPLTDMQVDTYLKQAGEQMNGLRQALKKDKGLRELSHQPLMLNIFTLAYQGAQPSDVPIGKTQEEAQHTIFARYTERMLQHHKRLGNWSSEQVLHWLTFLAKQMQQNKQTMFFVENVQPQWLPDKWKTLYEISIGLAIGLIVGVVEGVIDGPPIGLLTGLGNAQTIFQTDPLFPQLLPGGRYWGSRLSERPFPFPNADTWRKALTGLACGLLLGLVGMPIYLLICFKLVGHLIGLVGVVVFQVLFALDPFLRHFVLRLFLWLRGDLPLRLVPFLDEMTEKLILRKVGGSYIFVHRQLLDYFAKLEGK